MDGETNQWEVRKRRQKLFPDVCWEGRKDMGRKAVF
jgi:hypothetical protein